MDLEGSVDCDGTCSSLDLIGCEVVSHEECNRQMDEAIASLPSEKHTKLMNYLQNKHATIYRVLYNLGF